MPGGADQLGKIRPDPAIPKARVERIASLIPGAKPSTKAPAVLSRNVGVNEIEPVLNQFLEALGETIQAIGASVG